MSHPENDLPRQAHGAGPSEDDEQESPVHENARAAMDTAVESARINGYTPLATDHPHSYTVLRAVFPKEALLTKEFTKDQKWIAYGGKGNRPGAFLYSARTVDVVSLDALEAELRLLDKEPKCCFVAGAITDGTDRSNMRRIKLEHKNKKTGEVHPRRCATFPGVYCPRRGLARLPRWTRAQGFERGGGAYPCPIAERLAQRRLHRAGDERALHQT